MGKFTCHMCELVLDGPPVMRVSMIGFNWSPHLNREPAQLFDLCETCQVEVMKLFARARNIRLADVYEKNKTEWLKTKMENLENDKKIFKSRVRPRRLSYTTGRSADVMTGAALNYDQRNNQQVWKF